MSIKKQKRILLVGGSGFVGKNLQELLSSQFNFVAPGHKELDLLNREQIRDFFKKEKFDIVIHAANIGGNRSQVGIQGVLEANTEMFSNLIDNASHFGRLIFLGSGAEYGKQEPIVNVKESEFGKRQPQDEYGRAKYFASEKIAQMDNAINLRCFGIFGKYEDYEIRFISNAICRALSGLPIIIHQNVKFDYIYIKDLVKIIEYFIKNEPEEKFYNVGTGQPVELIYLAEIVKKMTGSSEKIKIKNGGLNREYSCDNSRLMNEIKNLYFTSYEQAIGEMVLWYRQNWKQVDQSILHFDA